MKSGNLYCKSIAIRKLPEFIKKLGGDPERLFAQAGLDITHVNGDHFYDWLKLCDLFTRIEQTIDEPSLGIRWAHDLPKDFLNSGPMLLIATLVPTMRHWFELSKTYQKLHVNSFIYDYVENTDTNELEGEVRVHPLSPPCHQFTEHIMAAMAIMVRNQFGEGHYKKVTFQHKAPADLSWHEKTFQCPMEFNAEKNLVYMPLEFLDTKLDGRLQALQPIVKAYLNRKINKNPLFKTSMAHTVERILPSVFGIRKSSMSDVANILGVSPKKLQRLLSEESTTYSEILDNVRKGMAKRLLFESDISISHLATLLDYASVESFNIASKRWFDLPATQYRKRIRIEAARRMAS